MGDMHNGDIHSPVEKIQRLKRLHSKIVSVPQREDGISGYFNMEHVWNMGLRTANLLVAHSAF
jgi:hypothetical protein